MPCADDGKHAMRTDDPRLVEAHAKMVKRVESYNDRLLTALKGHVALEDFLNGLLKAGRRRWKRRLFNGKVDVAQKLLLPELDEKFWALVKAGNNLRNAIAHGDKHGTINARITDLRKALIAANTPEQKKYIEEMTEIQMISSAFHQCGSELVAATERLEKGK